MKVHRIVLALCALALAVALVPAFYDAGEAYGDFFIPQAGLIHVMDQELAVGTVFASFALLFAALATFGLQAVGLGTRLAALARRLSKARWLVPVAAVFTFSAALVVRLVVLQRQVITDDEETYRFIAQTLALGRIVNPVPEHPGFYLNQFVVVSKSGWFGKYPLGHPALLALARALGAEDLLSPLLAAASLWLTWRLGRRLLGPTRARLGVVLLALSPHFVLSHATLLSQVTSTFLLMLALVGLVEGAAGSRKWLVAGAVALGVGILVRPLPGVLFAGGALLVWLRVRPGGWGARIRSAVALGLPSLLAGLLLLAVNAVQTGAPLQSGYHLVHTKGLFNLGLKTMSLSLFGAAWRENLWLLGWPVSLLPVLLARVKRGRAWLWMPVLAEVAYRLAVPKTVVATTGPTYTLEAVPVMALLASDGLGRAALGLRRLYGTKVRGIVAVASAALAVAGLAMFLPVSVGTLERAAGARLQMWNLLADAGVTRALVFADYAADPRALTTWAYYPPSPNPSGEGDLVFVRWPRSPNAAALAQRFWETKFADRPAFRYEPGRLASLTKGSGD